MVQRSKVMILLCLLLLASGSMLFTACAGSECTKNADCKTGQSCKEGKCATTTTTTDECTADADCKDATKPVCTNKKCVAKTVTDECTADADCKDATKPVCTNKKCVAKTVVDECTTNVDCKDTTKPVCNNKKCVAANDKCLNVNCPAGQTCDSADGVCKGGQDLCKGVSCTGTDKCNPANGKCEPAGVDKCLNVNCPTGQTCDPKDGICKTVADLCAGVVCGSGKKCDPKDGQCKDAPACTTDNECPTGQKCTNGKCELPVAGQAELGDKCDDVTLCKQGLLCISADATNKYCFRDCKSDKTLCGTDTCVELSTTTSICLKEVGKDEACDITKSIRCKEQDPVLYCSAKAGNKCAEIQVQKNEGDPCTDDTTTADPPLICDGKAALICDATTKQCKKAKIANVNEQCGVNDTICDPNGDQVCLRMSSTETHGYCFKKCTGATDATCTGTCTELTDKSYVCVPAGTKVAQDRCEEGDAKAASFDTSKTCGKDLRCITWDQGSTHGYCFSYCAGATDATCTGRCAVLNDQVTYICVPGGTVPRLSKCGGSSGPQTGQTFDTSTSCAGDLICVGDFCRGKCDDKTDTTSKCTNGSCNELTYQDGSSAGFMCSEYGNKKIDDVCGVSSTATTLDTTLECEKGLLCLRGLSTSPFGICVKTDANGCTNINCGAGYQCLTLGGGTGVCVKSCTSPADCTVADTSCETISAGSFCAPNPVYGPKKYGEVCDSDDIINKGCEKGKICPALSSTSTVSYCTEDCTQSQSCPSTTNSQGQQIAGSCLSLGSSSICVFECTGGKPCPDGLTCQASQGGASYCLAL